MNELYYIFYDAKRMYLDTSDMGCAAERAHRRLCDFIWFNDGPPRNQNRILKQITHTDDSDWGDVKRELLLKGWLEVGDFFLHRGAIKSLNESKVKYVENFNRQAKMNKVVPLTLSVADAVTGVVTIIVTPTVTPTVTLGQSESQPESESEKHSTYSTLKGKGERGKGAQIEDRRSKIEDGRNGAGAEIGDGRSKIGDGSNSELRTPNITFGDVGRLAGEIMGNDWGWFYDNCRVKITAFTQAGVMTLIRPFQGRATEKQVRKAWCAAVLEAHQMTNDFQHSGDPVKTPAGLCTQKFREFMEQALATEVLADRNQRH